MRCRCATKGLPGWHYDRIINGKAASQAFGFWSISWAKKMATRWPPFYNFYIRTSSGGGWRIFAAVGRDNDTSNNCRCSKNRNDNARATLNIAFAVNRCTGTCNRRHWLSRLYSLSQDGCAYKRCCCCSHSNFTETHNLLLQGFAFHSIRDSQWHNRPLKSTMLLFKIGISKFRCKDHTDFGVAKKIAD